METTLKNGFCEMTMEEMIVVDGGILDFVADIYDKWCEIWYDFGGSLYHILN